tara:strand:- start:2232 stop:3002 length:771 start_codon:yes stop_codon:yes gene_type:complete
MKVLILAGGLGTRLSEETIIKPKPMVEIGGKPILWHVMKTYSKNGFNEFIILLGYKGYLIKEFFFNYFLHNNDVKIDLKNNKISYLGNDSEPWEVTLLDTGLNTMTGSRIKRAKKYLENDKFFLTYGDGVSNLNMKEQLLFHSSHDGIVTMTAVQPHGRFGVFDQEPSGKVNRFTEKPDGDGSWINGGYFICEPDIFKYIHEGPEVVFENEPLSNLAKEGKLYSYKHYGFWKCMDTLRDKNELDNLAKRDEIPWLI